MDENTPVLVAVEPARLLETRSGDGAFAIDDNYLSVGRLDAGSTTRLTVVGRGDVPKDAGAVMLNVTAVDAGDLGFVKVYPCGTKAPVASNVNYGPGQTISNAVLTRGW